MVFAQASSPARIIWDAGVSRLAREPTAGLQRWLSLQRSVMASGVCASYRAFNRLQATIQTLHASSGARAECIKISPFPFIQTRSVACIAGTRRLPLNLL